MRGGQIARPLIGPLLLALAAGCAGRSAPWHVEPGHEERFRDTRRICRLLTDDRDGSPNAERFEVCMKRRGYRRQNVVERLLGGN